MAVIIFLFVLSYLIPFLFNIALLALGLLACLLLLDWLVLYAKRNPVSVVRTLPEKMSNGDGNIISWDITNHYNFRARLLLLDEFPESWQIRDFKMNSLLESEENAKLQYTVYPKERGEYFFGNVYVFIRSPLQFIIRRKTFYLSLIHI